MTEAYNNWVVEDRFPQDRPQWDATFVSDIAPFELMKLRLLNGAHSSMAYLGYLAGYEYISDVMGDADFVKMIHGLMTEEAMPTLDMPAMTMVFQVKDPSALNSLKVGDKVKFVVYQHGAVSAVPIEHH